MNTWRRQIVGLSTALMIACSTSLLAAPSAADVPGASVDSLLRLAREQNPEYLAMLYEAEAAAERVTPAGALPDPRLRTEFRDITRMGEQSPTLIPGQVGSTRYLVMQDVPWFGKRDLKKQVAEFEAEGARGRALVSWNDVAARIKTSFAQRYFVHRNARLTDEILELAKRLEHLALTRYANGLAPQQDVIRAQIEQTGLHNERRVLVAEQQQLEARINALAARPARAPLADPDHLRPLPDPSRLEAGALEGRARRSNPLLSVEIARLQAAEKSRELAYRNRYPDFTFGVSPIQYDNAVKEWEVMVELNIPLQQDTRRAQERESEAMVSAARARQLSAENLLMGEIAEATAALDSARRTEELTRGTLLPQAELTFRSALAGYEAGRVDFSTLIDALRQIRQARQSLIRAQAEGQARLADVERMIGEEL